MPSQDCNQCGVPLRFVTAFGADTSPPSPGDCTICLDCGALLTFEEDMSVRSLLASELEAMDPAEWNLMLHDQAVVRAANPLRRGPWQFG